MLIDKDELCELIPHAGSMCLLGGVLDWSDDTIVCVATSHLEQSNPLRRHGRMASVHLLEYGAQAVAIHGGLLARRSGNRQGSGYLASLQEVYLQQEFLDEVTDPLEISAQKVAISAECLLYSFTVRAQQQTLASARATIFLQPTSTPS